MKTKISLVSSILFVLTTLNALAYQQDSLLTPKLNYYSKTLSVNKTILEYNDNPTY
jgi:hypothetical protein